MTKVPRIQKIFLHFFDTHFLERKSPGVPAAALKKECRLATRFAILAAEEVILPAASYCESDLCREIIDELAPLYALGIIHTTGGGGNFHEFIAEKKPQYKKSSTSHKLYYGPLPTTLPPYLPRQRSATRDIKAHWNKILTDGKVPELFEGTEVRVPPDIEKDWAAVDEKLGRKALIVEYVKPLILPRSVKDRTIDARLHAIVNEPYFGSFSAEREAGIIRKLAYLESADPIPSAGTDISYSCLHRLTRINALLPRILSAKVLDLEVIRREEQWLLTLAACLADESTGAGWLTKDRRPSKWAPTEAAPFVPSSTSYLLSQGDLPMDINATILPDPGPGGFDEPLGAPFLADVFLRAPLLRYYGADATLQAEKPFANKRVLLVLHYLRDLLPFVQAMIQLGLDPSKAAVFYKEYPYPQRRAVAEWLNGKGIRMFPRGRIDEYCADLEKLPPEEIGDVVIVEDGGFFVPAMHLRYPKLLKQTVGVVEQTTRGIMNTDDAIKRFPDGKLAVPVLSVATSGLKNQFEPPYIGQAVIGNIQKMVPHLPIPGRRFTILGYGTIGQRVAAGLRDLGAYVTVYDRDSQRRLHASQGGFTTPGTPAEAVHRASFVIGCSGRRSIDADVIAALEHATHIVSASSELYEVDLQEFRQRSRVIEEFRSDVGTLVGTTYVLAPHDRRINVLANGYPINFWGVDSMPEHASDLIMTLLLLAAVEVARRKYPEPKINSDAINEIARDEHPFCVTKKFIQTHHLG